MYQCPHCKAQEKPMFFSSEHDLKLHIVRLHTGYPDSKMDYVR
jgi:glutaredoxin